MRVPMPEEEKLFYTIGEAAQIVDVKPYVLRYWESEFKKLNPQKSETGQRTYRKKDLQVALTIKRLLYEEKYTIAGALPKLDELEKEVLDQIDMFAPKPSAEEIIEEAHSQPEPVSPASEAKPKPVPLTAPVAAPVPAVPREKVIELKSLIAGIHLILKKYHLG